jgi:CDP-diacylglycerol--glycerol-3-phosphate 3-phosphatidyltransferase
LFTIPNLITVLRLLAVAFIVWLSYSLHTYGLAAATGLFTLAAVSDWLDGFIARRTSASSAFGTLMDPLVDKVMVLSVLFVFSDRALIPLWLVLLNMLREFSVTAARHGMSSRAKVVGANWMGKLKFVLQVALVELCYLYLLVGSRQRSFPGGKPLLFWATVVVTAVSFLLLAAFLIRHRRQMLSEG